MATYGMSKADEAFRGTGHRRRVTTPTRDRDGIRAVMATSASAVLQPRNGAPRRRAGSPRGRRYLEPAPSKEATFKPSRKKLNAVTHEEKKTGLKFIPAPHRPEPSGRTGRVYFDEHNKQSKNDSLWSGGQGLGQKIRVVREDGALACERQAHEDQLENHMGSKVRIDPIEQVDRVRNGIGVSRPGDKLYSYPEYAPGYFKRHGDVPDGTVPGSNWGTYGPAMKPFYETDQAKQSRAATGKLNKAPEMWTLGRPPIKEYEPPTGYRPQLTYDRTRAAELLAKDMEDVLALHTDWEDRTGMYTTKSKKKDAAPEDAEGEGGGDAA